MFCRVRTMMIVVVKPNHFHSEVCIGLKGQIVILLRLFLFQPVCRHYNRAVHYMKFALGAYGYPAYLYSKGIIYGLFRLIPACKYCNNLAMRNRVNQQ